MNSTESKVFVAKTLQSIFKLRGFQSEYWKFSQTYPERIGVRIDAPMTACEDLLKSIDFKESSDYHALLGTVFRKGDVEVGLLYLSNQNSVALFVITGNNERDYKTVEARGTNFLRDVSEQISKVTRFNITANVLTAVVPQRKLPEIMKILDSHLASYETSISGITKRYFNKHDLYTVKPTSPLNEFEDLAVKLTITYQYYD
jgi:hypothetical protein